MIQFYAPDILETGMLPEADSGHAIRVLRMREGDMLQVVDGKGHLYTCTIVTAHSKHTTLTINDVKRVEPVWNNRITIAVAPTKNNDRMEWLVEKLVEIGINRFVPVKCARSERKELKTERLRKIAVSAMKQSLKAILPEIDEMTPLTTFLAENNSAQKFVGYCDETTERRLFSRSIRPGADVNVLIGPEGDFTPEEIDSCCRAGYIPITMGDNRLRTETAALVACDTVHIINQLHQ